MAPGYPNGLSAKDIPLVGQIIRVADEFDAISSKRQYKTHIGISDTLKIIIENSNPTTPKQSVINKILEETELGKNSKKVVKALIKVVIDDTEYEISCIFDYIDDLKSNIKRLEEIDEYYKKMIAQKKESKKDYYLEGIKYLLKDGETVENYKDILDEYKNALSTRKAVIDKLFEEVKTIKKLKV